MDYFEQANLLVVPVQVAEYKGERIKYPNYSKSYKPGMEPRRICWQADHSENWVNWEERETFYPGVENWFALGGLVTRGKYFMDGMEIGYGVIDVDNHGDKEKFDKTVAFLSSIGWDDTLIVQTPSGGRHYYFWSLADYIPAHSNGCEEYAIEFKTRGGWLAPNGKDRIVISNKPIKRLSITKDSPFAPLIEIKKEHKHTPPRPTNPNFDIDSVEVPTVSAGDRHNTMLTMAMSLYARGCPADKIEMWGKKFYEKNGRVEQRNEISNIIRDAIKYIDANGNKDLRVLLEDIKKLTPPKPTFTSIFPGATPLESWDAIYAKALFSTKEEIINMVMDKLAEIENEDECDAVVSLVESASMDELRFNWAHIPLPIQKKFVDLKEILKIALA